MDVLLMTVAAQNLQMRSGVSHHDFKNKYPLDQLY